MKAIRVSQFGGPEVLRLEEIADPAPGPGEVRVKIKAAGVNPVETYLRAGTYPSLPKLPFTPGNDGAGIVDAVGPDVTLPIGTRVYIAGSTTGTYAEKAVAKVDQVRALADSISFEEGAGVGVPYITAYRAIFEKARVQPGESVLVHGGTGAVGLAAIQFLANFSRASETLSSGGSMSSQSDARMSLVQKLQSVSGSLPNFMRELIRNQARLVAGTEAAAFMIEALQEGAFSLKPIAHVREDSSDANTRQAAMEAFEKIVRSCVEQNKEGAIHIEGTWDGSESQYCLVNLLRSENQTVAASAVITRARDLDRARKLLELIGIVGGMFELLQTPFRNRSSIDGDVFIVATGSTEAGRTLARQQGARHVIDHRDASHFEQVSSLTGSRGVDVILEMLANQNLAKDLTILAKGGRVVIVGSRGEVTINPRELMKVDGAILGLLGNFENREAAHAAIDAGLRGGWLKPMISQRFSLGDAPASHRAIIESSANGKVVLIP